MDDTIIDRKLNSSTEQMSRVHLTACHVDQMERIVLSSDSGQGSEVIAADPATPPRFYKQKANKLRCQFSRARAIG